ncbi:MAG TPA: ATP-binding protein [Candidatus Limnocylindrales bacterium]|nr:ATP-binding protein [Candidatus Limnocylindrales bacterium]
MTSPATAGAAVRRAMVGRTTSDLALGSLPVGVLVCTSEGDEANEALHHIWRRPAGVPFRRRSFWRTLQPLRRRGTADVAATGRVISPITAALAGRASAPRRYRLHRDDGTTGTVRAGVAPMRENGVVVGAVVVVIDETAEHDTERLRDAFLGILGHELRTPITSIIGGSELLQGDLPPDVRAEVSTMLADEANRLHRLVDQLLRLATLQRSEDAPRDPVALLPAVRRSARKVRAKVPRAAVVVSAEGPLAPAAGDEGYVEQVISILFDNAIKYAGAEARIDVRVVRAGRDVEVHVLDDGPGLPQLATDAVFRLFHRGPGAAAPDRPGAGIGLFVARAIVDAMGGRIWAENRPEGGADVGFALPIAEG